MNRVGRSQSYRISATVDETVYRVTELLVESGICQSHSEAGNLLMNIAVRNLTVEDLEPKLEEIGKLRNEIANQIRELLAATPSLGLAG